MRRRKGVGVAKHRMYEIGFLRHEAVHCRVVVPGRDGDHGQQYRIKHTDRRYERGHNVIVMRFEPTDPLPRQHKPYDREQCKGSSHKQTKLPIGNLIKPKHVETPFLPRLGLKRWRDSASMRPRMKRLKVWHRIAILFLVLLAVNIISLGIVSTDKNLAIKTVDKERDGIVYLEPLRQLRQLLPQYRRVAESNPKLLDPKANAPLVVNLDKSMTRLDDLDRKLEHELTTTEDFVGLKGDWKALQKAISSPEQLRKAYDKENT